MTAKRLLFETLGEYSVGEGHDGSPPTVDQMNAFERAIDMAECTGVEKAIRWYKQQHEGIFHPNVDEVLGDEQPQVGDGFPIDHPDE